MFGVLSFPRFTLCRLNVLLRFKCPPTKRIKTSRDLQSVVTSASLSTLITIAPHTGNLERVMTPV